MGLEIDCARCGDRLQEPGALFFGPPTGNVCAKLHICVLCISSFDKWLSSSVRRSAPSVDVETEFLAQRKLVLAIQETLFPGAVVPPTNEVLLEELRAHVALSRANGG